MDLCHVTLTAERESRLPLFSDEAAYREALHRIGKVARDRLALHGLLPEHVHLLPRASRAESGRLAQATIATLRPLVATPLAPSFIREVKSRAHLRRLLRYFLEQPLKHSIPGPPALWVGSCLPDLIGARQIPGLSPCIAQVLPEFTPSMAARILDLPLAALEPVGRDAVRAAGAVRLRDAAAAALALDPTLPGRQQLVVRARAAVAQLARWARIPGPEVVWALGVSDRTIRTLVRAQPDRALMRAVCVQLSLASAVLGWTRKQDGR